MRRESRFQLLTIAAFSAAFVASSVCCAVLIAYDDFESYTAGNNLNGGSGGTGWAGNWVTLGDHTTVQSKQLDDPNGNVDGGLQAARFQPTADLTDISSFIQRAIPVTSGTLYLGILIRKEVMDGSDFVNFLVSDGDTGNATAGLSVGLRNAANNPFFVRVGSSSNGQTTNGSNSAPDTDYLIVVKFSKDGSATYNRADLFIDPADENEPGTPGATAISAVTGLSQLSLFSVRNYQPESGDLVFIDELRFADTFADAVGFTPAAAGTSFFFE